jgi:hypothetical protein
MLQVRTGYLVLMCALFGSCAPSPLVDQSSKPVHHCEIHRVPTVEKLVPETPLTGIEDNGYHPEVQPYFDAKEKRFPYVGFNLPDGHSYRGGPSPICLECVKAEDVWVAKHPRVPSPIYGSPDPRRE